MKHIKENSGKQEKSQKSFSINKKHPLSYTIDRYKNAPSLVGGESIFFLAKAKKKWDFFNGLN